MSKGPTNEEVKKAKQGIIDSFPSNISSNAKILNIVATIGFYDLPLDYLDTYRDKISAITVDDINTAFNKIVKPQQLITVSVGASSQTQADEAIKVSSASMLPISW